MQKHWDNQRARGGSRFLFLIRIQHSSLGTLCLAALTAHFPRRGAAILVFEANMKAGNRSNVFSLDFALMKRPEEI
ncbi:hypothetical protein BDZ97DRAFT_1830340 [Flammula alnicola]|nr:hypothetical protein BDZ97DRAFT_1830340 [Flammula alnicola]